MKLFLSKTQKLIDTLWRTTVCAELQSFYLFYLFNLFNWSEKSTTLNSVRKECEGNFVNVKYIKSLSRTVYKKIIKWWDEYTVADGSLRNTNCTQNQSS